MTLTGRLVLPADVELTRVRHFDEQRLSGIGHEESDWVLTRPGSRTPSSLVADDLAALLERFRGGARIVDAVISHAAATGGDAYQVLEEALPALNRFMQAKWLVPEGSELAEALEPWYLPGDQLAGLTVMRCVRVVEDAQVYQARSAEGDHVAVKLMDEAATPKASALLQAEASVLQALDGVAGPRLMGSVTDGTRRALVMEWCEGVPVTRAADERRQLPTPEAHRQVHALLIAVLQEYASLHQHGVLHGDVNPDNVVVDADANVRLLDFGLARRLSDDTDRPARGGVPDYMDPELAQAFLEGAAPPPASTQSEQYSVAALCYRLATGASYTPFPKERNELLACIVKDAPLPFIRQGAPAWPDLEDVLFRALAKDPRQRFPSLSELAAAVGRITLPDVHPKGQSPSTTTDLGRLVARVERRLSPGGHLYVDGVATGPRASVMVGAAGIAYYLLRAAMLDASAELLVAADEWTERANGLATGERGIYDYSFDATVTTIGRISPFHTRSGIEVMRGLVAHARGDDAGLRQAVADFVLLTDQACADLDASLGRSSVVLGSALLARAAPEVLALRAHADRILRTVWDELRNCGPIGSGSGPAYTGIAHGWAGILYTTLVWSEVTGIDPPPEIESRLTELASLALPEGRGYIWPAHLGERTSAAMSGILPGWCHGSAGHVHLWNAAGRRFGRSEFTDLATKAAWNSFETDGGGATVCCGGAGRVFSLLSMYRHSGDAVWLRRAKDHVVKTARQAALEDSQGLENSLYKGELGLALAIRELDYPEDARHPLFEIA